MKFTSVAHHYPGILVKEIKTGQDFRLITSNPDSNDLLIRKTSRFSKWVHAYDFLPLLKEAPHDGVEMSVDEFLYFLKEGYDLFGLIRNGEAIKVL